MTEPLPPGSGLQDALRALAGLAVLAVLASLARVPPGELPGVLARVLASFVSRAWALGDLSVAAELGRPPVGVVPPVELVERLEQAVRTIQSQPSQAALDRADSAGPLGPDTDDDDQGDDDEQQPETDEFAELAATYLEAAEREGAAQAKQSRMDAARLRRLAKAATLAGGQDGARAAMVARRVPGWRRRPSAGACELCTSLAADNRVLPMSLHMARHNGCACTQQPAMATKRELAI